jgi:ribosomal protein S3
MNFFMGQKVHPLGFRIGITKSHQSQWFARFQKHQYSQAVLEDRLLRQTLLKMLPEILAPFLKKTDKNSLGKKQKLMPKITHIKIERGYIPYEIGIQIHAGNVELLKSAVDYLKVNQTVLHHLQKTRGYLTNLRTKLQDLLKLKQQQMKKRSQAKSALKEKRGQNLLNKTRFSYLTSLKKRKNLRRRFKERWMNPILILKKGSKITRLLMKPKTSKKKKELYHSKPKFSSQFKYSWKTRVSFLPKKLVYQMGVSVKRTGNVQKNSSLMKKQNSLNPNFQNNLSLKDPSFEQRLNSKPFLVSNSEKTEKFVDSFMTKTNEDFVDALKTKMKHWQEYMDDHKKKQIQKYGKLRYAPLGLEKKWRLTRLNRLEKRPWTDLYKLAQTLKKKAFAKMEILRREFFTFGTLSQTESFNYYQRILFIKSLKQLIHKLKLQKLLILNQNKTLFSAKTYNTKLSQKFKRSSMSLAKQALTKKFTYLEDECRKIKLISYLTDLIQQHRQKHLYYYLATIVDSQKSLQNLSDFVKKQSNYFFGSDFQAHSLNSNPTSFFSTKSFSTSSNQKIDSKEQISTVDFTEKDQLKNQVKKAISEAHYKNEIDKNLSDVFVQQVQRQRIMFQRNMELVPKISLKFYSVKPQILESKASFVADNVVEDLEKRKAFRQVIKQAKEKVAKYPKVKGVKIQVSGRLNGAEIARSEWVRKGQVPLQTLKANIDYCYKTASTIYGIIGVKVWIYKGPFHNQKTLKKSLI